MKLTYLSIVLLLTIVSFSCRRSSPVEENADNTRKSQPCGEAVVANAPNFSTVTTDDFVIADASVSGDCLTIKVGGSGCSGNTWQTDVLHAVSDAAVYPRQHALKVVFTNKELCAAALGKSFEFDLYPLRQKGTNKISLSIYGSAGYYKTLQYAY